MKSVRPRSVLGYDHFCGGLVLAGRRGGVATCQGCGLFSSIDWWTTNPNLVTRSDRKFTSGTRAGPLRTVSLETRARMSASQRARRAMEASV